jgi:hypothetical protein
MACRREHFLKLYCLELLVRQVNPPGGASASSDIVAALKETASKAIALGFKQENELKYRIWDALEYALENLPFVPGTHHRFGEEMFEVYKEAWEEFHKQSEAERVEREQREAAKSKSSFWPR